MQHVENYYKSRQEVMERLLVCVRKNMIIFLLYAKFYPNHLGLDGFQNLGSFQKGR